MRSLGISRPINMTDWNKIRQDFPITQDFVYLDAASLSPIPRQVMEVGKNYYNELMTRGDLAYEGWSNGIEVTRSLIANNLNADVSEIAFVQNTSLGMNLVAQMLPEKGEMLTVDDEFPSSTIPWIQQDFSVTTVKSDIEKAITANTKVLVISHVQYKTGFCADLMVVGEFCRKNNLIFVVNATQSFGVVPIDVKKANIDFLVFNGIKWGISGNGTGSMFVAHKWLDSLKLPIAGCESTTNYSAMDNHDFILRHDASALEVGTANIPNILAMGAGVKYLSDIGIDVINSRISELVFYLIEKLIKLKLDIITPQEKKSRAGIIVIKMPNAKEIAAKLREKKIMVSARGEGIRVSVYIYNNTEDIDRFLAELAGLL